MSDLGNALASSLATTILVMLVVAAVAGWALIEGLIWVFHHVRVVLI